MLRQFQLKSLLTSVLIFWSPIAIAQTGSLSLSKTVDNAAPAPGNPVEFVVTLSNDSSNPSSDVEVTDRLPPGLSIPAGTAAFTSQGDYDRTSGVWAVGSIPGRSEAILTIPAVAAPADSPTCYENLAEITDPASTNIFARIDDAANASILAGGATYCADLALQVPVRTRDTNGCGIDVFFDATVQNGGPAPVYNVAIELDGNPQGRFIDARALEFIERIDPNASETINFHWNIQCENPAQTVDYSVRLSTATILSNGSVSEFSGQLNIPRTGGCEGICESFRHGASSDCFIATAAYGSQFDPHVAMLRGFRDNYLLQSSLGRRLVGFYYRVSPPVAAFIANHEALRVTTRAFLAPVFVGVAFLETESAQ